MLGGLSPLLLDRQQRLLCTLVCCAGICRDTIASFELAWEQGADAIEADFLLTSDGHLVCTHDAFTGKFNKPAVAINQTPLAELQKLDFGAWFGADFAGEQIPTIAEVFATVPSGKQIYIELKEGQHIVAPLKTAIEASDLAPEQIVIISFKEDSVAESKLLMPHIKALLLSREGDIAAIVDAVASTQADGVSINKIRVTATLAASLMQPEVGGYVPSPHTVTRTHTHVDVPRVSGSVRVFMPSSSLPLFCPKHRPDLGIS